MNNLIVKSPPAAPELAPGKVSHGSWLGLAGAAMCVIR
jgi:peptide/nickel transport system permease protein